MSNRNCGIITVLFLIGAIWNTAAFAQKTVTIGDIDELDKEITFLTKQLERDSLLKKIEQLKQEQKGESKEVRKPSTTMDSTGFQPISLQKQPTVNSNVTPPKPVEPLSQKKNTLEPEKKKSEPKTPAVKVVKISGINNNLVGLIEFDSGVMAKVRQNDAFFCNGKSYEVKEINRNSIVVTKGKQTFTLKWKMNQTDAVSKTDPLPAFRTLNSLPPFNDQPRNRK